MVGTVQAIRLAMRAAKAVARAKTMEEVQTEAATPEAGKAVVVAAAAVEEQAAVVQAAMTVVVGQVADLEV